MHRASVAFVAICALSAVPGASAFPRKKKPKPAAPPAIAQISPDQKIPQFLSRLTFGPRPGDVERVRQLGLDKWIDRQLHPESIPENPLLEAKLRPLDTLLMTPTELVYHYPSNQLIKAMVDGRVPYPSDPETRHMIEKLIAKYKARFDAKTGKEAQAVEVKTISFEKAVETLPSDQRRTLESGSGPEKVALLETMPANEQMDMLDAMPPGARQKFFALAPPDLRRRIQKLGGPQQVVNQDLADGKLYRAVYSDRQLEEVLTDFWFNHFNVYLDKGADRYMVTSYERDAIRPHVLGNFKDLLLATAESPAMLFYLDNFQSVGPDPLPAKARKKNARGLNENYGRELMELHTLGVDGGYTQHDVTEVARCFTGWTIRDPQRGGSFQFNERAHDKGEKVVLGHVIPAGGGMEDGLQVIDILVNHPSTARFISKSLAIRFVSDTPPASLIDKMANTFSATHGDLREVMKTMIFSPEFTGKEAWRAKFKTPLEMVASAIRATGGDVDYGFSLTQQLNVLGEPLYRKQEPTGYSNKNADWLNSAALLARMNFALALTNNKVPGVKIDLAKLDSSLTDVSDGARAAIAQGLQDRASSPSSKDQSSPVALAAALTIGSPEFQRR
ncbi:MAG: DUF1800 family protein [Acidobacteriota bacterium]|nr:DUF1800 family protein [Acidobacteriota bacterium]